MLADDLLEDASRLADFGNPERRESAMRRAVSTAYYSVFHLLVADFIGLWPIEGQRSRLARMFTHAAMRNAVFTPRDNKNPTDIERQLLDVIKGFGELQRYRHRADYVLGWKPSETDVNRALSLAQEVFSRWWEIRHENIARDHLLTMFGARLD